MPRFYKKRLPELLEDFRKGTREYKLKKKYHLSSRGLLHHLIEAGRAHLIPHRSLSRLLIERTGRKFPQNPEARTETMLHCMNGELKQAVLLAVGKDPLTSTGIRKCLVQLTDAPLPGNRTFYDYCAQTLTPAGLLIHELYGKGWGARYSCFTLSKAGERYGQPIAAFSLRYAVDHNVSLYDLFGPTSSSGGTRAPYNRARIIELLAQGCTRIVDLEKHLGLAHTDIYYHLKHLRARAFVRFASLRPEPGRKTYRWVKGRRPEEAKTVDMRRRLTAEVASWLQRHKVGTRRQIAREVNCEGLQDVSKVLVGLEKQGLAQTQFASTDRSVVELGERSQIILDYVQAVRSGLMDKSRLPEMTRLLQEFKSDPVLLTRYVDAAVELYRATSPGLNRRTAPEREALLVRSVSSFQKKYRRWPRRSEMTERLGWNHGTIGIYLNSLLRQGRLVRQRGRSSVRYRLTRPSDRRARATRR